MDKVDVVIVGGGIAGSLAALELLHRGHTVRVYDAPDQRGSSDIAAGSINPITGRFFVKSWNVDLLIDRVEAVYSRLEKTYGVTLLHRHKIIRAIKTTGMLNDWSARMNDADYLNYVDQDGGYTCPYGIRNDYLDFAIINSGFRVDNHVLMSLINKVDCLMEERFDQSKVQRSDDGLLYNNLKFKYLIFAEGAAVRHNRLWNWLPFVPARGERLIIHAPELKLVDAFNDNKIIIPLGEDRYWVGSNYDRDGVDLGETDDGFQLLKNHLDQILSVPYTIEDHASGIRPATYNRRPFLGEHPDHPDYYLLNGLGAKGASLAPWCVEQLCDYILDGKALDAEVDLLRV